jgi:hypothetical protein
MEKIWILDLGSEMENKSDPGKKIPDPQHCFGSGSGSIKFLNPLPDIIKKGWGTENFFALLFWDLRAFLQ